ncbi:MAG: magnesium chelatase [Firmicutes bacterium]|jgi:magnesium chelatase subunit I|nr:magnesium chelatase [Bacillota bacterium]
MRRLVDLVRHEGNECLFKAIEMSIASTLHGFPLHVHVEGLRGTGKTTILRSARAVFPTIRRVRGCLYNCDPERPHCPEHSRLDPGDLAALGTEEIPVPFLEISHSAKVGTVVGSIDLKRITDRSSPEAAILPGTIPQAHRGFIFVDEINRLAETSPELADTLLSVMGTKPGRVQIEETGLPIVELPVRVSVWAASNPDEDPGPLEDIRRQLADRFDFVANVSRPTNPQVVKAIFAGISSKDGPLKGPDYLSRVSRLVEEVTVPAWLQEIIAGLYVDFALESLRSVEALQHGSRVAAALDMRREAGLNDLIGVVPLALHHRVSVSTMAQILKYLTERSSAREPSRLRQSPPPSGESGGRAGQGDQVAPGGSPQDAQGAVDRLFSRLRETLMRHHAPDDASGATGFPHHGRPGGAGSRTQGAAGAGSGGGDSGGGGRPWANPLDVEIAAPRARAVPIIRLSPRELIKTGEDLQ